MAADDMPAEFVAGPQRALEMNAIAAPPLAERGDGERLGADVKGNGRPRVVRRDADNGQADSRVGDGGPDGDRRRIVGAGDRQSTSLSKRRHFNYFSDVSDNSREHAASFQSGQKTPWTYRPGDLANSSIAVLCDLMFCIAPQDVVECRRSCGNPHPL